MKIDKSWYQKPSGARTDISAGGVVIRIEDGHPMVALVSEAGFSRYFLPKGRVEADEDLQAAARREIKEEAGLSELNFLEQLGVYERLNYTKKTWKVIHYFLFQTEEVSGFPTDTRHSYHCGWFPLDKLPPLLWPEQGEVLERLQARYSSN